MKSKLHLLTLATLTVLSTNLNASMVDNVVNEALSMKKNNFSYVWGHKGIKYENEVDCSGLMYQSFKRAGITINNNIPMNVVQYSKSNEFKHISFHNMKRGDMIVWKLNDKSPKPDHITIYLGNNKLISSENEPLDIIVAKCFTENRPPRHKKFEGRDYTWWNRYTKKRVYSILRYKGF